MSTRTKIILGIFSALAVLLVIFAPQATSRAFGATTFNSQQLAPSASNGYILSTNGTDNSWIPNTGGSAFSFTPQPWGNSTSTTVGFLNGLLSNGSTTVTGTLHTDSQIITTGNTIQFAGYSALPQVYAGDSTTGLHFDAPGIVSFHNGGVQTMLLSSTQRVGIATSSPFARLSIHANANDSTIVPTLFAIGSSTASATTTLFSISNTGAITTSAYTNGALAVDANGAFYTYSTSTWRFASSTLLGDSNTFSGTLNIFTNAPKLGSLTGVIYGNNGVLNTAATSTATLGLGLSYSGTLGSFVGGAAGSLTIATSSLYSGTTGQFPVFTGTNTIAGTSNLFMSGTNIGIGTTTPQRPLTIDGNSTITTGLRLSYNAIGGHMWDLQPFRESVANTGFEIYDRTAGANRFDIDGSGNVGIGTTTPDSKLDVSLSAGTTIFKLERPDTQDFFTWDFAGGNVNMHASSPFNLYAGSAGTTQILGYSGADNALRLYSNGSERITVTSTGNVGISSTSPWATLSVNSTAGIPQFVIGSSTTQFIVDKNGNVGIGTTTPRWLLQLASPTNPQLALSDGSLTSNIWTMRSIANSFFVATASPDTFATTTYSVFSISPGGQVSVSALQPATSTSITLDWSATPNQVEYQIGSSATTITLTNATTSAFWGSTKRVWVCNPGSTAGALTWAGVEWIGIAPTQTTTANQCDIYSFNVTRATSTSAYKVGGSQGAGFQ